MKKFFVTAAFPYVNGYLHLGHLVTYIKAEITARYKKMRGYDVLFPMGFHATGAPIYAAAYKVSIGDPKQIETLKKMGIKDIEKFKDPAYWVEYFSKAAKEDLSKLGFMIEWERSFTTVFNKPFHKFVEWQYHRLREKGYIYRGAHPIVWDPKVNMVIGDHDRPDDYAGIRPIEGVIIKFYSKDLDAYLPAFTLRPETVFGVVNIWVNPETEYVLAKVKKVFYVYELYSLYKKFGRLPLNIENRDKLEKLIQDYNNLLDRLKQYEKGIDLIAHAEEIAYKPKEEFVKELKEFAEKEGIKIEEKDIELLYEYYNTKVETQEEKWILPNTIVIEELKNQDFEIEIIGKIDKLIKTLAENPVTKELVPVLPAKFVDPEVGTGIVMSVPSHAPYDYVGLLDLIKTELKEFAEQALKNVRPVVKVEGFSEMPAKDIVESMNITSQEERDKLEKATQRLYSKEFYHGVLTEHAQQFQGLPVKEAKMKIAEYLMENGYGYIYYTLPVRFKSRYGNKVVVKLVKGQWFIKYSDKQWKELAHKAVENMKFYPPQVKELIKEKIDWYDDWAFTHQKELGTALPWDPKWVIESLSDSTIYTAYYTIAHILQHPEKYNIDWDKLTIDVFDYVFLGKGDPKEIAKKTGISEEILKEMRNQFEYWYPVDIRFSAQDLIANHLVFYIFHHVAIFPESKWPRGIAVSGFVTVNGEKMSKSKGNFITIREAIQRYGRDAVRLAAAYAGNAELVDQNIDLEFMEKAKNEIIPRIESYLDMEGYDRDENSLDKWIVNRIRLYFKKLEEYYENIRPRDVINEFFKLENDFNFYRALVLEKPHKRAIEYFKKAVKALWPIIPHVVREPAWIGKEEPDEPWIRVGQYVDQVIKDLANTLKLVRISMARNVSHRLADLVKLYYEGAKLTEEEKEEIREFIEWKPVRIKIIYKNPSEFDILRDIIPYIEKVFGGKVVLELASESKEEKAKRAKEFKPAFVIE
ncbi:NEQ239 [Nanoarchaeum equitans Kin4-M]|uniref:Leucine--tRNA ligase n=1 Tax=Nanoarchaeum equitans (strain Kin4-M) TaxID=228908 RepID=SYL_NANEQ|nr:RecName: Full=Leucine--tRNA ligase; AltName: Full=Leucyl-tRNA synthetase; Short=LeuRS [Nanoarchaeum equitans Kin4-M]AAR39092.1 NEQ239 [Nanoarchaeum equitans Kin4-M]